MSRMNSYFAIVVVLLFISSFGGEGDEVLIDEGRVLLVAIVI
jgi:hypothetical protein